MRKATTSPDGSVSPLRIFYRVLGDEMCQKLESGEVPADVQIWSTQGVDWISADSEEAKKSFAVTHLNWKFLNPELIEPKTI